MWRWPDAPVFCQGVVTEEKKREKSPALVLSLAKPWEWLTRPGFFLEEAAQEVRRTHSGGRIENDEREPDLYTNLWKVTYELVHPA
ncbi:hypothetical protein GN958_ATG15445 [Phytophthora infestans]|uniref:Uncharacterized protein n=1 Tax=Phytophthora infestans TaxID=4787 RepID=A0A8S9U458_PHYIN|nr:hypothetical protein GN958_ATG15445 [Phytophthora infestans]